MHFDIALNPFYLIGVQTILKFQLRYCFLLFIFGLMNSISYAQNRQQPIIIQKPIVQNQQRDALSLLYLKTRHGILQEKPTIVPKMIVLHYTGSGTLESNFNYFNKVEIENARTANKNQSKLNVSAHFLVDRDGSIYQLLPENYFARHTIGLNYLAIGIENVGGPNAPLTTAQVNANAALVRYLCSRHAIIHLIGHSEYVVFKKTKWWKETNANYYTGKNDPGADFMKKVRAQLLDLNLKATP